MSDHIEVWHGQKMIYRIASCFAPAEGELINIEKTTWKVTGRSWTVDYAATREASVRCNLIVEPLA